MRESCNWEEAPSTAKDLLTILVLYHLPSRERATQRSEYYGTVRCNTQITAKSKVRYGVTRYV